MLSSSTIRIAGVELPRVGLGTNRILDTREHHEFLRSAVDAGVRHIDTAHLYTDGASEIAIGNALAPFGDDLVVATKGGYDGARPDVLRSEIEESLHRLQVDAIGLYYLHRPDPEVPFEESIGALAEERDAGRIRHVGLSQVSVNQVERAREIVEIAAVQHHYSLVEQGNDDLVSHCESGGIVFVPFFPLRGVDHAREGLAWLLERSVMMLPIPGTLSIEHLRENLEVLDL
jgi:aryl-alcohol dehydrogenase-like predicted oxidoreductase